MKAVFKPLCLSLIILVFLVLAKISQADPPPPPADHGSSGNQGPGPVGAPIDGGLGILLSMGIAYGGRKYYQARKVKKENEEKPAIEN